MMVIKAKFRGQDGSLGYKNGRWYELKLHQVPSPVSSDNIEISRMDNTGICQYDDIYQFLNNWTNVNSDPQIIKR